MTPAMRMRDEKILARPQPRLISIVPDSIGWFASNRRRFPAPIRLVKRTPVLIYAFAGISALQIWVSSYDVGLAAFDGREQVDLIALFYIDLTKNKSGKYVCDERDRQGHGADYEDRAELLSEHVFEPFLEWCTKNLRRDRLLLIEEFSDATSARICSRKDLSQLGRKWSSNYTRVIVTPLFAPHW